MYASTRSLDGSGRWSAAYGGLTALPRLVPDDDPLPVLDLRDGVTRRRRIPHRGVRNRGDQPTQGLVLHHVEGGHERLLSRVLPCSLESPNELRRDDIAELVVV